MSDMEITEEEKEKFKEFECVDCSVNTYFIQEYYMVQFGLWFSVMPSPDSGMLCIGCLEERLGRTLTPEDFIDAPVNYGLFGMSDRFKDRAGSRFTQYL